MPGKGLMADLLTKPIVARNQWMKFYDFLGLVDASTQSGDDYFPCSETRTSGVDVSKIAGLASWNPSSVAPKVGLAAVSAFTAHLFLGKSSNSHPTKDLKRARSKETFGPPPATTEEEAPRLSGVETRKTSGLKGP